MKLLGSLTSPYVRKVRIVLAEKKVDYEWVLTDVWTPTPPASDDAPTALINTVNPLHKVPALMLEDGSALFDSRVIVEYIDTLTPVHKLIPTTGRARAEVRCWEALADGVADAAVAILLEQRFHEPAHQSQVWLTRQHQKIEQGLHAISVGVSDKPWVCGATFSLADICVGSTLGYLDLRQPELQWRNQYNNLAKLYDKLMQRNAFAETAPPMA
jgi:glutathione S-transferase